MENSGLQKVMLLTISVQRSQWNGGTYYQCTQVTRRWCYHRSTKVTRRWCYLPSVYKGHKDVVLPSVYKGHKEVVLLTISVQRSQGGGVTYHLGRVTYHQCTKVTGRWCYLPSAYKGHREVVLLTINVQRSQALLTIGVGRSWRGRRAWPVACCIFVTAPAWVRFGVHKTFAARRQPVLRCLWYVQWQQRVLRFLLRLLVQPQLTKQRK